MVYCSLFHEMAILEYIMHKEQEKIPKRPIQHQRYIIMRTYFCFRETDTNPFAPHMQIKITLKKNGLIATYLFSCIDERRQDIKEERRRKKMISLL